MPLVKLASLFDKLVGLLDALEEITELSLLELTVLELDFELSSLLDELEELGVRPSTTFWVLATAFYACASFSLAFFNAC